MELMPIKRGTLVEKLVATVRHEITSGRLVVGQTLPTEAKMAAQFGVSRPLLREALAELRAEGFVETVSGRGTFVRHPTETDLADAFGHQLLLAAPGPGPTADHLYEARQAIEVVAAELAATRAEPDSLEILDRLLATMTESRNDAAAYTAADVGFHVAVARATLNPLLPTLLAPLATLIVKGMYESHSSAEAVSPRGSQPTPGCSGPSGATTPPALGGPWRPTFKSRDKSSPRSLSGPARPRAVPRPEQARLAPHPRAPPPATSPSVLPSGLTTWSGSPKVVR